MTIAPVNEVRGEREITIGDVTLKMAATMEDLARLSAKLGRQSPNVLINCLATGEPDTMIEAIRLFTKEGSVGGERLGPREAATRAIKQLTVFGVNGAGALQEQILLLLEPVFGKPGEEARSPGKAEAGSPTPSTS